MTIKFEATITDSGWVVGKGSVTREYKANVYAYVDADDEDKFKIEKIEEIK